MNISASKLLNIVPAIRKKNDKIKILFYCSSTINNTENGSIVNVKDEISLLWNSDICLLIA